MASAMETLRKLGVDQNQLENTGTVLKGLEMAKGDDGIYDFHVPALRAFLACDNQWRIATGFAGAAYLGLDYAACDVSLRRAGIELTPEQWGEFQAIERAACSYQNKGDPLRDWQALQAQETLQ